MWELVKESTCLIPFYRILSTVINYTIDDCSQFSHWLNQQFETIKHVLRVLDYIGHSSTVFPNSSWGASRIFLIQAFVGMSSDVRGL